ncbi:MAG TPA: acetate--CoA ligase family protein [Candidatus Acidoferrales bacterium]|nr:acetate--CoA ligase family protein [Candidatus Acidoferrales bacterium]
MAEPSQGQQPAASSLDLSPLLAPRAIAVIGASERGHYPVSIRSNLLQAGFPMESVYPVNPRQRQVFGVPCFPSVKDIPGDVDLAMIVVPHALVASVARECAEKGVRALCVISNGFAEVGEEGKKRQEELAAIARANAMLLLGPNTLGFMCPRSKAHLWSSPLPKTFRHGSLAAIFHSSGMLNLIVQMGNQRGLGFSVGIAPGNEAGLNLSDYLAWAIDDPETRAIALVIESIRNPRKFRALLERAAALRKPIIALRLGKSARARRSIASHTGSLASGGEAWDALFEQTGVIPASNLDELLEAAALVVFADLARLDSNRIGLMTISGGDCSLLSDICDRNGLALPDLDAETRAAIASELGKDSFLGNPLDVEDLLTSKPEGFYRSLEAFAQSPQFSVIGCRLNIPDKISDRLREGYRAVADAVLKSGKQLVLFSRASEQLSSEWFEFFSALKVPFLLEYEKGLRSIRKAVTMIETWAERERDRREAAERRVGDDKIKQKLATRPAGALRTAELIELFDHYAIPFVPTKIAHAPAEAAALAESLGFPVVLKIASVDIPHRSDIGAVRANLKNPQEVESAFAEIMQRAKTAKPEAAIEGMIVQPMIQGVAEVILGVSRDPQLGPVVLLGSGGIFVEIIRDAVLRLPPLTIQECRRMIDALRGKSLLTGARGRPPGDTAALAAAIHSLAQLALDLQDSIEEIDLNPVIVLPEGQGVLAVDGLVVTRAG